MSYTKHTLNQIIESYNNIQKNSIEDNDLTDTLQSLNSLIEVCEKVINSHADLEFYCNEIISDAISAIYSAISGNYRLSITGLRNVLELGCSTFFYMDHKIELKLFVNEDYKSQTYVSFLINNYSFFTTQYIKTFYNNINDKQSNENSVSIFLKSNYEKLCDVVHGRFLSLTKRTALKIEYSKEMFKKFETVYTNVLSALAVMYILRCNDFSNQGINILAIKSRTITI